MNIKLQQATKVGILLMSMLIVNMITKAANFTAVATGNWSSSTTWVGGVAPSFTNVLDVITIPSGLTVTLDNNLTLNGVLAELNVGGILISSAATTILVTSGTVSGTGEIYIGNVELGALTSLTFTGSLTVNTLTNAVINLQSAAKIKVIETLTLLAGVIKVESTGTLTMMTNSNLVMAGGILSVNGGLISLTNKYNLTYSSALNTIAGLELTGVGLNNLTIDLPSTSNTLTLATDLTIPGILTLTKGTLVLGLSDLTIAGDIATNGEGNIYSSAASDITINSSNGITGTVKMKANSAVNNFTLTVGSANHAILKGWVTINGLLNLNSGTLILDSAHIVLKGNIETVGTGSISSTQSSVIEVNTLTAPIGMLRFKAGTIVKTLRVNIITGGSVKIGTNLTIQDSLTLNKGNIDIGNNSINMAAMAKIVGGDSNSYIITNASGRLSIPILFNTVATTFPVGTNNKYHPATVLLNTGSALGTVSIGVIPQVYAQGITGTDLTATQRVVNASWAVESDIVSNMNMNLSLMWPISTELNGFSRTKSYISHYANNKWDMNVIAVASLNVNGLYSLTRTNVTSLSPYAVFDNTATGVNDIEYNANFEIYPNPATDIITIVNNQSDRKMTRMEITNINGQVVASFVLTDFSQKISLSNLQNGYYFIKLSGDNMSMTKKFVKM